ncbi:hypothetical protein AB4305_18830, partial [Nocardia sp. 2YAB30]|uniref:hypothetical protein n=1 Tax=unclassified Nocardia TaxID=2637762 RepID=UPI003F97C8E4
MTEADETCCATAVALNSILPQPGGFLLMGGCDWEPAIQAACKNRGSVGKAMGAHEDDRRKRTMSDQDKENPDRENPGGAEENGEAPDVGFSLSSDGPEGVAGDGGVES